MKETYNTKDLGLAGALQASNIKIEHIIFSDGIATFCFVDRDNTELIAERYFARDLRLDAITLYLEIKNLKNLIFSQQEKK